MDTQDHIKPQLRTFDLTIIVAGLVIGMGIFGLPSKVAQNAGIPEIFFLAWITGGVVSFIGALIFAEIGSRFPVAGGFYKIFSHCYHPAFAFMVNWVVVLSNAGATAGVAILGAEYIAPVLLPGMAHDTAIPIVTISSMCILYVVNMLGIRMSSRMLNVLMFVKFGLLLLLILAVFIVDTPPNESCTHKAMSTKDMFAAFLLCFTSVFFAFGGYQQTINFGKDIPDARRTMPRAIFFGICIIVFIYLAVNYSLVRTLGFEGLANSKTIASDITGMMFGAVAHKIVAVVMFLSVMAYVNVGLISNPRVYYAMAEDKVLPPIFKKINSKTQVQEFALTIFCAFILVTLFFVSSFQDLVDYVMFFDSIGFMTAAASIFILRYRAKKEGEPEGIFKIKGYPVLPAFFILVYFGVNMSVLYAKPKAAAVGALLFIAGMPLYYLIKFVLGKERK